MMSLTSLKGSIWNIRENSVIRLRTLTVWQRASEISVSMQVLPGLTDLFTKQSVGWQT